ncbi:hypothetical protein V5799_019700 [Amblyomma americanum]|uniref:TRAF1-6 MATH domain-containing protein n=1 Tax=Amblyomma americanum TaxID=6943 RepID=A0AAQ4EW64_AMBAM
MHDILTKGMRDLNVLNEEVKQSLIAQSAAINNLSETIGDLEKKLKDEISNATSGTKEHVTQNASNIKAEVKESVQRPLEKITEVMRCGRLQATECNFSVPHVKSLKKKALKEGSARYEHKVVYLRGYCVLPAVWLVGEGGSVKVHAGMTLYKGDMDDIVQWPLKNKVRLSVNHQRNGSKLQFDVTARYFGEDFHRPRESHNDYFYFGTESLYLGGLFAAGYVENDKLFVNWELLPLSAHQSETE